MAAPRPNAPDPALTPEAVAAALATLIAPGSAIAVAVSGGADSLALVHLLKAGWQGQVTALVVDHGLRAESAAEARQVMAWLDAAGIAARRLDWTGPKPSTGLQAKAREARYSLMGRWCLDHGVPVLVTAHHGDDQDETIAMRRRRASGPFGLRGMDAALPLWPGAGAPLLARPLLGWRKADLAAWLTASGIAWIEDPSNRDLRFERVRLRQQPVASQSQALVDEQIIDTAQALLAQAEDDGLGGVIWRVGDLEAGDAWLLAAAELLDHVGGATARPRRRDLIRLNGRLAQASAGVSTIGGCRLEWRAGRIVMEREWRRIGADVADSRFDLSAVPPGCRWRPLGEDGWRALPESIRDRYRASRLGALATPALWRGDTLVAAPVIHFWLPEGEGAQAIPRPIPRIIRRTVLPQPPLPLS